jgi:predicted ATP-grasp superfamily ATP-dependent carboligase
MQLQDNSTPVVILRSIAYCGLGVARSLGRLGVPVYTVEGVQSSPVFHSRYNRRGFVWSLDERPEAESLQYLREVSTQIGGRPLLIPTTDYAALFVARNSKQLGDSFRFPEQPKGLVAALSSKKDMYLLAKRIGIPTPETSFPQKREDVLEFLASARLPVMLKAIDGTRLCARTGKKMFIVRSAAELLSLYDKIEEPGAPNLMLQEYIPGGEDSVWMFNGYFNEHSECLLGFTGQKIRQCPAYTGYTSLGICRRNEAVDSLTRSFMKSFGYRGILDVGYRYDARDCKYKVLDVNPRIGATFRLFVGDNGMDVARAFYLDMTGQPVPETRLCEGRKWMVEDRDLMSSIRYWRDGNLAAGTWLRSLTGICETAYLASDDMGPVFARLRSVMSTAVRRGISVLKQATSRPSHIATHTPSQPEATLRAA